MDSRGCLFREGSVSACCMAIIQSQGWISIAAKALKKCSQLPARKAAGDTAHYENETFPSISFNLLHNREHHVTITPKSSSLKCAIN